MQTCILIYYRLNLNKKLKPLKALTFCFKTKKNHNILYFSIYSKI